MNVKPRGVIFTVCSHTFTLIRLRKTYVIVETYRLSFPVFMCAFHPEISSFFLERVSSFFSYFCIIYSYHSLVMKN